MQITQVNPLAAFIGGQQMGEQSLQMEQANKLRQLYQDQGGAIAAGDQNALAQLAQFDPAAAMQVQQQQLGMESTRLGMENTRATMDRADRNEARLDAETQRRAQAAATEAAASMSAAEAAAAAEETRADLAVMATAQDAENWDRLAIQTGNPELIGQFDRRNELFAVHQTFQEVLEQQAAQQPEAPSVPAGVQTLQFRAEQAGLQPGTPEYQAFMVSGGNQAPVTNITNNMPDPTGGVTETFYKNLDADQAEMFGGLLNQGATIPSRLAQVDELDRLLTASPTGAAAAFQTFAGEFGINTEGLSDLQAAQAIINRLVPAQRAPGSGPMSDADLELFKQSLPRLINSPQGNKQIVEAMRGLIVYEQQQTQIANRVASREITPSEGRELLMALDNPLRVQSSGGETVIQGDWEDLGNGIKIRRVN